MKYTHENLAKQFWNGEKDGKKLEMDESGFEEALRRALKDFTPRTEKRIAGSTEKLGVDGMFEKLQGKGFLKRFVDFFNGKEFESKESFDDWHEEQCNLFLEVLKKDYEKLAYGKAQKIVNMTFKGIYCLNGAEEKEKYFRYCHMPLDSLTLEWFKRKVKGNVKIEREGGKKEEIQNKKIPSWSKLQDKNSKYEQSEGDKYTYMEIQTVIREFIDKKSGWTLLKAEFLIWPQIQLELAAEGLYSNLLKFSDLLKIEEHKLYSNKIFQRKTTKEKFDILKETIGNIDYDFICGELSNELS